MPAKPVWLLRVPEILEEIEAIPLPFLDRATIEKLFGVRRRRAHQLLAQFGGFQVGRTYLVYRTDVLRVLRATSDGAEFRGETKRKLKVVETVNAARREMAARAVPIEAAEDSRDRLMSGLAPQIHLVPGELRIRFDTAEELLRSLFELSQAMVNDYQAFEKRVARH